MISKISDRFGGIDSLVTVVARDEKNATENETRSIAYGYVKKASIVRAHVEEDLFFLVAPPVMVAAHETADRCDLNSRVDLSYIFNHVTVVRNDRARS